jgi:peptidoglycan hydrolase CwlO-like protein
VCSSIILQTTQRRVANQHGPHKLPAIFFTLSLQLRRACEATADELSSVIGDRTALRSELDQAQLSIDALAAELQETADKAQAGEARSTELEAQLQESQQARSLAQQQVGGRRVRAALGCARYCCSY